MIKIIKTGTRKKCTCEECGCLFSYDECEDVLQEEMFESIKVKSNYILCPQCGIKISLSHTRSMRESEEHD